MAKIEKAKFNAWEKKVRIAFYVFVLIRFFGVYGYIIYRIFVMTLNFNSDNVNELLDSNGYINKLFTLDDDGEGNVSNYYKMFTISLHSFMLLLSLIVMHMMLIKMRN